MTYIAVGFVQDNFLLIADSESHILLQVDLTRGTGWKIPGSYKKSPYAVAYDPRHSKVYWTDTLDKVIKKSNLNGTQEEVVRLLDTRRCFLGTCVVKLVHQKVNSRCHVRQTNV